MTRRILIVPNPRSIEASLAVDVAVRALAAQGVEATFTYVPGESDPVEAVLVLGGDGTMLYAVQLTYGSGIPLLGVNLGHVGFFAELERDDIATATERLATGQYTTEKRSTLGVTVQYEDGTTATGWALNEATVERSNILRTLEVAVEVDGHQLSSFGCDGLVISTSTGSTAHAFSAGGPVMWPDVDALLFVPLAAHALFARPLVVGPGSYFTIAVLARSSSPGTVVCDGARSIPVPPGARVDVRRGTDFVTLVRTSDAPFTERLVRKFNLPTVGWRGSDQGREAPFDELKGH